MPVKLTSWNLREGLALPEHSQSIVENILHNDSDIVLLPDAYWLGNPLHGADIEVVDAARGLFEHEGYNVLETEYQDDLPWPRHFMMLLSRLPILDSASVRLGNRNGLKARIVLPESRTPLQFVGVHFDDRSELLRLRQTTDMLDQIDAEEPAVLVGDFNAMHAADLRSRVLRRRAFQAIVDFMPTERTKTIVSRVAEMALGNTLRRIEQAGFLDVDHRHQPTMPSYLPMLDLDHCFVSEGMQAGNFQVQPRHPASDHLAFSVPIAL